MQPKRRRILFADKKLQGTILLHVTVYWFYCLLATSLAAFCWIALTKKPLSSAGLIHEYRTHLGPALVGSLVLLPMVLTDCLRLGNRFAGPMVRLRRALDQLARGERPNEVHLRDGDFWHEFAGHVNQVIRRMDAEGLLQDTSASESGEVRSPSQQPIIPCPVESPEGLGPCQEVTV